MASTWFLPLLCKTLESVRLLRGAPAPEGCSTEGWQGLLLEVGVINSTSSDGHCSLGERYPLGALVAQGRDPGEAAHGMADPPPHGLGRSSSRGPISNRNSQYRRPTGSTQLPQLNLHRARPGCPRLCSIPAWQHPFQTALALWAAQRLSLAQILSICYANAAKITFYNL